MTTILGIDPGLSGALAVVRDGRLLSIHDMPAEPVGGLGTVKRRVAGAELAWLLRHLRGESDDLAAVVERVGAMPGQGVASTFSLGDTSGAIRGVLQSVGLRVEYVTPAAWKRALAVPADKGGARTIALARWPEQAEQFRRVKDHNRAEAALIALYGWERFA
jgi:crossover junction endodeoxyribonuclease RuvC